MKRQYYNIFLGLGNQIPSEYITSFYIVEGFGIIPYGKFVINDISGKVLSSFQGLALGSDCRITLTNPTQSKKDDPSLFFEIKDLKIIQIKQSCDHDTTDLQGSIEVSFGHPWYLLKDMTNHSYPPTNNSKLIRQILKDQTRGMEFKVNDEYFDSTDDVGILPRYKICESDYDFIFNKVLPYSSVKQTPVHFWADLSGEFKLRCFQTMYKEQQKAIIGPEEGQLYESQETIENLLQKLNLSGLQLMARSEISLGIGSYKQIQELYPMFQVENQGQGTSVKGSKYPGNKLGGSGNKNFQNVMPVDFGYMHQTTGTDYKTIANRHLADSLILLFQGAQELDNMFTITVSTDSSLGHIQTGDTVELFVPKIKEDGQKPKIHWANGKWLVKKLVHTMDGKDQSKINSICTLSRPTFVGNKDQTSLDSVDLMYGVS